MVHKSTILQIVSSLVILASSGQNVMGAPGFGNACRRFFCMAPGDEPVSGFTEPAYTPINQPTSSKPKPLPVPRPAANLKLFEKKPDYFNGKLAAACQTFPQSDWTTVAVDSIFSKIKEPQNAVVNFDQDKWDSDNVFLGYRVLPQTAVEKALVMGGESWFPTDGYSYAKGLYLNPSLFDVFAYFKDQKKFGLLDADNDATVDNDDTVDDENAQGPESEKVCMFFAPKMEMSSFQVCGLYETTSNVRKSALSDVHAVKMGHVRHVTLPPGPQVLKHIPPKPVSFWMPSKAVSYPFELVPKMRFVCVSPELFKASRPVFEYNYPIPGQSGSLILTKSFSSTI